MPSEYAEEANQAVYDAFDGFEEEARARSMALRFGIDFDAPPMPVKQHKTKYRHPHLNGESDG